MKTASSLLCFLLLAGAGVSRAQVSADSNVLVARGVLSRSGKAGSLWHLKPHAPLRFRDELILQVTFTTRAGAVSRIYGPYEMQYVELAGEVKEVFHGNAVLSKVRTIGIVESPAELLKHSTGTLTTNPPAAPAIPAGRTPYQHAYYLFLAETSQGCEGCYVPLLITQGSLDEIVKEKVPALCVFVITYERDSIWEIKGAMPVDPTVIEAAPRFIHVNGKTYRYQEVSPVEVVKLLEEPLGTIAISRPGVENKTVPGASLSDLQADFRALLHMPPANEN